MSTKSELLRILTENLGSFVSGERVAADLGVSRMAVSKAARSLREAGYRIDSRPSYGYRMKDRADLLTREAVSAHIREDCELRIADSIASCLRSTASGPPADRPLAVVADVPDAVRRPARSTAAEDASAPAAAPGAAGTEPAEEPLISPGLSGLMIALHYIPDFDLGKSLLMSLSAGLALANAVKTVTGTNPRIKWPNTVMLGESRVAAIRTEGRTRFETGLIDDLTMNIIVSCFPQKGRADGAGGGAILDGCIAGNTAAFSRAELAAEIINRILKERRSAHRRPFLPEYRRRCMVMGRSIRVDRCDGKKPILARAIDIDSNGGLVVEYMEGVRMREIETVTSGSIELAG